MPELRNFLPIPTLCLKSPNKAVHCYIYLLFLIIYIQRYITILGNVKGKIKMFLTSLDITKFYVITYVNNLMSTASDLLKTVKRPILKIVS